VIDSAPVAVWRGELERTVRPVPVVVACVHAQDTLELPPSKDQDAIETATAHGAHPALRDRVCVRRLHGRPGYLDPLRAKDLVESTTELPVRSWISSRNGGLRSPSCMTRSRPAARPRRRRGSVSGDELEPARRQRDEEEDVDPLQPERLDGEEIAGERAGSLLAQE
jgi:hypothetical protein